MSARKQFEALKGVSVLPDTDQTAWLSTAPAALEFLKRNASSEYIVVFAIMPCSWMAAALAPNVNLVSVDREDLRQAQIDLQDTWATQHSYGGGDGHRVYLEPPLARSSRSLEGGEMLLFRRTFYGMDRREPFELSQKLAHALGVFFVDHRSAYCRIDDNGDLEDIINIFSEKGSGLHDHFEMVAIRAKELAEYMALSDSTLVRRFDFTRVHHGNFHGWGKPDRRTEGTDDLSYSVGLDGGNGSWVNGYQLIRTWVTTEELVARAERETSGADKEYETFIAHDWKHGRVATVSCAPDETGNYFVESDKPHELSPVFFRAEVLARYKADPSKYTLEDRSITCRSAWYLKSYDINEEGQVHTYLCDLAHLPIAEQRYWKAFNEEPKGTISKRAIQNDFQGTWSTDYDPISSLKAKIQLLNEAGLPWWSARTAEIVDAVHYPATASEKEWADEILALDQMVVEGLIERQLRTAVEAAGGKIPTDGGSLNALQALLIARAVRHEEAKATLEPLRLLHRLRSKVKGHSSSEKAELSKKALSDFRTYRAHFTRLTADVDTTLGRIFAALGLPAAARE